MEIHVIRHTQVDVESGVCYGQSEVGLRHSFHEDAMIYEPLKAIPFDAVYTSRSSRCVRLAELLGWPHARPEPRLMELNFGEWELKRWSEIPTHHLNPWMEQYDVVQVPGGESYEQMYTRVCDLYETLRSQNLKQVLWITHAGVIRCLWARILGIPLKHSFKIPVGYGEHFVIETTHETILKKS